MKQLYNNIKVPDIWPPVYRETTLDKPLPVPYMEQKPAAINIDIGRQLFCDDFLIAQTDLKRVFKQPVLGDQPIFEPETPLELNDGYCTCACPFNDGIFYDDQENRFKMWYHGGWFDSVSYAESEDGIHWKRLSEIDPARKSDRVIPYRPGWMRDGAAVWLDYRASDPRERYKMLVFYRVFDSDIRYYHRKPKHSHDIPGSIPPREETVLYRSANGIDWEEVGTTGPSGDNTTFFQNPFTGKWVYSLRTFSELDSRVRVRGYYETDNFFEGRHWKKEDIRFWTRTDIYDLPDPQMGYYTQLYNLDATPYESLMLGVYSVFMGPPNNVCGITGKPKINDLKLAFSRDGFHWDRPVHENFIASSRQDGSWDYGYLHAVNGVCTVVKDEIYFYYSCFSGKSPVFGSHKYSGGSLGLARLRRDGFAAMEDAGEGGSLTTEALDCAGDCLFINGDSRKGRICVEVLDQEGRVIPGFSREECIPFVEDSTCARIVWRDFSRIKKDHGALRLKFYLENASLYSFWITDRENGQSHGYMAAGGPGFQMGIDG